MGEEKWKANMEKVAFMKQFPGLVGSWEQIKGKTIETVTPLPSKPGYATLAFTDGSFIVAPPLDTQPKELGEGLTAARTSLEPRHPEPYKEYDRLVKQDKDATRVARLEKIIGAIQNNLEQIPELKDRIRQLVKEWK
jgi:diglucosylglycerate octanoyltransferase